MAVSPDTRHFVTGSTDGIVRIYNLKTGEQVRELCGHSDSVTSVCFVSDERLCSASADNTLSLWSASDGHR